MKVLRGIRRVKKNTYSILRHFVRRITFKKTQNKIDEDGDVIMKYILDYEYDNDGDILMKYSKYDNDRDVIM